MNNKTVKKGLLPYVFLLSFIILGIFIYNHFDELEIGGEDPSNKIEGA